MNRLIARARLWLRPAWRAELVAVLTTIVDVTLNLDERLKRLEDQRDQRAVAADFQVPRVVVNGGRPVGTVSGAIKDVRCTAIDFDLARDIARGK